MFWILPKFAIFNKFWKQKLHFNKIVIQQKTWQQRQIVHHILNWIQTQLFAKTLARNQISDYFTYRADINRHPNIRRKTTDESWLQSGLIQAQEPNTALCLSGIILQFLSHFLTFNLTRNVWSLIKTVFHLHTAITVPVCFLTVSVFSSVSPCERHPGTGFSTAHF